MSEPDWSESKTGDCEIWKNPLIPMDERLLIADGAIRFRNEQIAKLKEQNALLTVQVQPIVESVAKAIYQEWAYQTDYVPWQNGGNSFMQDKARDRARAALATLPQQVKSEDAMDAARYRHVRSGILNCSFIVRQARYDGKWVEMVCAVLDEAIDAAIAAQGSKG